MKPLNYISEHFHPSTILNGGQVGDPVQLINVTKTEYMYKYNGKEFQDELGLNMYAMDMRQYDPAIARWVVMDPVIHHDMSPYNAFDNNPVYWADPSGADATSLINDIVKKSNLTGDTEWVRNNDGTFSGSNGKSVDCDDCIEKANNHENTYYKPTFRERLTRLSNYTSPAGVALNTFQDFISLSTQQPRHKYGPDAIMLTKNVEGGSVVGGTAGGGFIIILRGAYEGGYALGDYGVGLSTIDISTGFTAQALYYSGNLSNMKPNVFGGDRVNFSFSFKQIAFLGLNLGYSPTDSGNHVYGFGGSLGLGASFSFFTANLNYGNTKVNFHEK